MLNASWWLWAGPIVCVAVMVALGYGPTRLAAGYDGIVAMIVAQVMVLAVVYATLVNTVRQVKAGPPSDRLQAALKAGVLRFTITLLLSCVIIWRFDLPAGPLLIWVALSYLVIVQVETLALVRWMATLEKQT